MSCNRWICVLCDDYYGAGIIRKFDKEHEYPMYVYLRRGRERALCSLFVLLSPTASKTLPISSRSHVFKITQLHSEGCHLCTVRRSTSSRLRYLIIYMTPSVYSPWPFRLSGSFLWPMRSFPVNPIWEANTKLREIERLNAKWPYWVPLWGKRLLDCTELYCRKTLGHVADLAIVYIARPLWTCASYVTQ